MGSASESSLIPTSPRSVQACLVLGIDPLELVFRPLNFYRRPNEDEDVSQLRAEKNEQVRQERLRSLIDMRKKLIEENWDPAGETSSLQGLEQHMSRGRGGAGEVRHETRGPEAWHPVCCR